MTLPSPAQTEDCALKRETDGIKVYTCKTENEKFKSLRADFQLKNTTHGELAKFLWDVSNYPAWQYNTIEADLVSREGEGELVYHSIVDAPWPIENRELLLKIRMTREDSVSHYAIENIPYSKPPDDGLVRVPVFIASWRVVSKGNDLNVTYRLKIDPGGTIPAWLVNIAMAEGPYVSFKKLKEQIEK
jgi:START domain